MARIIDYLSHKPNRDKVVTVLAMLNIGGAVVSIILILCVIR
jgi:hypothetical protein